MPVFLLTDVEGSTRLWDERADEMSRALERHDEIVVDAITRTNGRHKRARGEGDSHFVVFEAASDAVACALEIQLAIAAEPWPHQADIRVRIGIHAGPAQERDEEYYGSTVNRAARLRAIAHGGQTVVSKSVADSTTPPDGASLRDRGSHRLKDLEEPERVFELVHPALGADFPPLLSLEAVRHNLPVQLTSFIGREEEVIALRKMLEESRLVTLAGTGGLGKTRLSLQVAAELVDEFVDGVWFVELAAVTESGLVAGAILDVLRVRTTEDALRALVDALRGHRMLLVLDNCEQVIEGVAAVVGEIGAQCPDIAILATSREPIAAAGERVVRLPALSTPDVDDDPLVGVYPAVRLFVERATSVRDDFVLDERTTAPVVRICRRLDGVPLAIELAAARVNVLTPQQIDQRLDDRFRVLASGPRTADRRQRTLRGAVEWSHDLLDDQEQTLFRRLAVFAGGFTLEGVEQVCSGDPIDGHDVLDLLAALVDKSLVVAEHSEEQARYRMLETIAAYARDRLVETDDLAQMRDAHLRYYTEATRLAAGAMDPELSPSAMRWVRSELDNIRAAADHAVEADPGAGLAMLWHTSDVWETGHLAEGAERYRRLLEMYPAADAERLYGLTGFATLLVRVGHAREALEAIDEAVLLARRREHTERLAASLTKLAMIRKDLGDLAGANEALAEAETIARRDNYEQGLAHVLTAKAVLLIESDVNGAIAVFEEALRLRRRAGLVSHIRTVLTTLANAFEMAGRLSDARSAAFEALEMAREADDIEALMYSSISLGRIALAEGDQSGAKPLIEEGLRIAEDLSLFGDAGVAHSILGELARAARDLDVARFHYDRAHDYLERSGQVVAAAFVRSNIARLAMAKGNLDEARTIALGVLAVAVETGFDSALVEFLELLAEVDAVSGNIDRALRAFGAAEELRERVGAERELVDQADYDNGVVIAREAAGENADTLWAAGREAGAEAIARATLT